MFKRKTKKQEPEKKYGVICTMTQARAILDLDKAGFETREICNLLGVTEATCTMIRQKSGWNSLHLIHEIDLPAFKEK